VSRSLTASRLAGAVCLTVGLLVAARPRLLAERFAPPAVISADFRAITIKLAFGIAIALVALGSVPLCTLWMREERVWRWLPAIASAVAFVALGSCLADWMIDDAAITFAYSENLVRGYGLRLHPGLPAEEAYSNTLWMLWLAALRAAGIAVSTAAKVSCVAIGAATCVVVHHAVSGLKQSSDRLNWLVACCVLLGAPYLVWSSSGLEHSLQGLAILCAAASPIWTKAYRWLSAIALAALVLLRPEAPLLVVACWSVLVLYQRGENGWWSAVRRNLIVALLPALTWAGLAAFRLAYFGDPLPNPYYAKASKATFMRLVNPVGGAWDYICSWAFGSGILIAVPAVVRACQRKILPLPIALALSLVAAHVGFIIYASGDWMGCWRFVAPMLPSLAFIIAWAYDSSVEDDGQTSWSAKVWLPRALTYITVGVLALGGVKQYLAFLVDRTTPYAVVASIGEQFVDLAIRLGIQDPVLAHHDAGGTSYKARIKLLDLGGLGSRTIAKHMNSSTFLSHYILDEVRPDFIFGSAENFAAGSSHFWQLPEFNSSYVPIEFPGKPYMKSGLCHIRRDRLTDKPAPPGIEVERADGKITKVVVR
jgi:hypothetical protein